jgi:Cu/Ag efflux protein CusF
MNEPLGNGLGALVVSAGLLSWPGADFVHRPGPSFPSGPICRAQFETNAPGVFHGVGIIKQIQAGTGALTLDHEDIAGLMPAMEMMYRVATPEVSRGLEVGDRVAFDVDGKSYTILSVKLISR